MKVSVIFHCSKSFKAFKQNFLYTELRHLLTKLKLLPHSRLLYKNYIFNRNRMSKRRTNALFIKGLKSMKCKTEEK